MIKQSKSRFSSLSLIAVLAFAFSFSSCSSDDDEYPKNLTYKSKQVVEFKLYVGSENGGIEVSTKDMDPMNYWEKYIVSDEYEMDYSKLNISFTDDKNVAVNNQSVQYRFDNGVMSIYDEEDEDWEVVGYGSRTQLALASAYGKYRVTSQNGSTSRYGIIMGTPQDLSINEFIGNDYKQHAFSSLSEMKHKEDTIMWCNIHYIYE